MKLTSNFKTCRQVCLLAIVLCILAIGVSRANAGELVTDDLIVNRDATFQCVSLLDVPTQGLLLYYGFTSEANPVQDESGNNHSADLVGATWTNDGVRGGCLYFDGDNDSVKVLQNGLYPNHWTWSAWFKCSDTSHWGYVVTDRNNDGQDNKDDRYEIIGIDESGCLCVYVADGSHNDGDIARITQGQLSIATGEWYMVSVTFDGSAIDVYLNDSLVATESRTIVAFDADSRIGIGGQANNRHHFEGLIDEVRFYDRALSATEIVKLYILDETESEPSVRFYDGIEHLKPLGDVSMGSFTNKP